MSLGKVEGVWLCGVEGVRDGTPTCACRLVGGREGGGGMQFHLSTQPVTLGGGNRSVGAIIF